ncbi:MAG: hypothetical protein ACLGGX_00515 [Bdellovibrionia bacterium]
MAFRIIGLIFSLVVVLYVMQYMKSDTGNEKTQGFFELLAGQEQKPFNWCGADTVRLVVLDKEVPKEQFALFCEHLVDTTFNGVPAEDFRPVATAEAESSEKTLEVNSEGVFRAGGLPFKSEALSARLKEFSN